MNSLGIDIGSRFIKAALVHNGQLICSSRLEATFEPLDRCREILREMPAERIVATGYGRHLLEVDGDIPTITEIEAFARGARSIFPGCRTIIDIGGQDTKVIALSPKGSISRFEMNDRCAAGTGKFLEVMATALGFSLDRFAKLDPEHVDDVKLSSMCAVFAESEVVSLVNRGIPRERIAVAIHQAVASRVAAMAMRFEIEDDVIFAGGCANNHCLRGLLEQAIGRPIHVAAAPEITGALGAALYAAEAA